MTATSRLIVNDGNRALRNYLEDLIKLELYGDTKSDVIRSLVLKAYLENFIPDASVHKTWKEKYESQRKKNRALHDLLDSVMDLIGAIVQ